ncbi:MAG: hypothetical protein QNJ73_07720 [Gammaproteobacteria bacterium]|nr:hypothetical protein [Gammaproteobacteria bacterium]
MFGARWHNWSIAACLILLVPAIAFHFDVLYRSGIYHDIHGNLLFGVSFLLFGAPFLPEIWRSRNSDYVESGWNDKKYFDRWFMPIWVIAIIYFIALFGTKLYVNLELKIQSDSLSSLFSSAGAIIMLLGAIMIHRMRINWLRDKRDEGSDQRT